MTMAPDPGECLPFDVTTTAPLIEKDENDLVVNGETRIGASNMRRLLRDGDRWSP